MPRITDQRYLVTQQYKNSQNLCAREELHARFSTNPQPWFDWVFDHLEIPPFATILEVGCGDGSLWTRNRGRIPLGWRLMLGDLSQGMLQEAKLNLAFLGKRAQFQTLDAQLLLFENESFEAVIANHMLYHVPNVSRAILEADRVLKPQGKYFAATNGRDHMQELHEIILGFSLINTYFQEIVGQSEDRYSFSLENGEKLLREHFRHVKRFLYPDSLVVTEVEPLEAYIRSLVPDFAQLATPEQQEGFTKYLKAQLESHGGVCRITKSSGMFVCYK